MTYAIEIGGAIDSLHASSDEGIGANYDSDDSTVELNSSPKLLGSDTEEQNSADDTSTVEDTSTNKRRSKPRRTRPLKSYKSDGSARQYLFCPVSRRVRLKFVWFVPLTPIPDRQPGIAWTGVYRRTPILIFSPTVAMCREVGVKVIAEKFNLGYKLNRTDCRLVHTLMQSHGFTEVNGISNEYNLMWTNGHIKPTELRSLQDFQRVNHFPRSFEITRKDKLAQNIKRMQCLKGVENFDIIPETFILPHDQNELRSSYLKGQGPYIIKPIASSRGRGIQIVCNPDVTSSAEQVIVSKYIANPLLIDGFKFDLRLYVAITSYSPLTIYIYEEGLVRFATVRYQKDSRYYNNLCMHLTNYSINKKNRYFVHNNDADVEDFGNKWSLGALLRYLKSEGQDTAAFMLRIEDIIIKAFIAVEDPINHACRLFMPSKDNCFEFYGFDIIVDENMRPYLLEVNLSPSLACDTPLDFKVKSNMLSDLLNLAGIIVSKLSASSDDMTANEQRLVRRFQEQTARCGGWLRIFPCPATWAQYAPLLYGNSQPEKAESPQLHWCYSSSAHLTSTQTSTSMSKRRADSPFSANVSAVMAVSAMQKVSNLTLKIMEGEEDGEITLVHPNLTPPKTNVRLFIGLSKLRERNISPCNSIEEPSAEDAKLLINMPALQASDANILLPIHSLSVSSLSECLMVVLGYSLQVSSVRREQANRVFACYTQTLGRLPFYHRKIGTLPTCIRGVCLLAGCGHTSESQMLCGMRMFYETSYESVQMQTDAPKRGCMIEMCDREKEPITSESITQYQARLIFSTYLTRVHSRINEQLDREETTKSSDSMGGDKEIKLILRFLQKATLKLSPQSVKLFYRSKNSQSVPQRPLRHGTFSQISDFPENAKLNTEQSSLLSLLDKFIQIYDHETASLFINRDNCEGDCITGADFQRFLDGATENDLEDILNQYARKYHSLSLFSQLSFETQRFHTNTEILSGAQRRVKITPMQILESEENDGIRSPVPHSKNSKNLHKNRGTERRGRSVKFSFPIKNEETSSPEFS
ncbi:hypothetical protein Aperf_G00000015127 [Anoplocephala perfoliata]